MQPRVLTNTAMDPELGSFSGGRKQVLDNYQERQGRFNPSPIFVQIFLTKFHENQPQARVRNTRRELKTGGFRTTFKRAMQNTGTVPTGRNQGVQVNNRSCTTPSTQKHIRKIPE